MNIDLKKDLKLKLDGQLIGTQIMLEEVATYRAKGLELESAGSSTAGTTALITSLGRFIQLQKEQVENKTLIYLSGMLKMCEQMHFSTRILARFNATYEEGSQKKKQEVAKYEREQESYACIEMFIEYREEFLNMEEFATCYHLSIEETKCLLTRGYKAAYDKELRYPMGDIKLQYSKVVKDAASDEVKKFLKSRELEKIEGVDVNVSKGTGKVASKPTLSIVSTKKSDT